MGKKTGNVFIDMWDVIKGTIKRWNDSDPFRQSAIIAFYAIFSLPALLIIIIAIVGYFFGEEAVEGEISNEIASMLGKGTAESIEQMVAQAVQTESSTFAAMIGIGILLFGATAVFFQLQKSLNRIWGVRPRPEKAFMKYLKDRLFSFGLILAIGFLMLIFLLLSSLLTILGNWFQSRIPDFIYVIFHVLNFLVSFGVATILFALIFKILPDAVIKWKSVWVGAMVTAFLFELGKFLLSIYFSKATPESIYGGAGSIILILLWVSYVCMILFLGAEFTRQFAIKYGHGIKPKENAEIVEDINDPYFIE
ncbi:MAG: YihY/virulence factor BrkB family protein [Bacteroidetes bacterium]|nr:YihY/virulence factor BrkB family protein [Bacteroidota bacterium]HET6243034.1 YihY/virulence factor BrkB family protein [Bacteroidia bacterium]